MSQNALLNVPKHTKHNNPCVLKAKDDEPIFVLRAQDRSAQKAIHAWLNLNPQLPYDRVEDALDCCRAMDRWQAEHRSKDAD